MNTKIDVLFKLLQNPSIKDQSKEIDQIDNSLSEVTAANFHLYGKQMVIYGDILYENTYDEKGQIKNQNYYNKLQNFYMHLRAIGKLNEDRDITKFQEIVDRIISYVHTADEFAHSTKSGTFCYYFISNRFNKCISECKGFTGRLVLSLIPNYIDYIDEENLERCIILAIQGFKEDVVQQFILYFYNIKRIEILNLFMQYALLYGRCETVEWLLNKNISLPSEIEKVIFILQVALVLNNQKVFNAIQDKFPVAVTIEYCLRKRLYDLAKNIIGKLDIGDITLHGLILVTEIAAACGDIEALKVFLEKCKPADRETLYEQHILPFYIPINNAENINKEINLQNLFNQKFAKMVATISFYMSTGRFSFSLDKAKDERFTLVDCGELRKLIAFALRHEKRYEFGTIRLTGLSTPLFGSLESYGKKTDEIVQRHGKETKNKYLLMVDKIKDYHVYAQLPKGKVRLTVYHKADTAPQSNSQIYSAWKHTQPKYFPIILDKTQGIWLQFNQLRKRHHDLNLRITALHSLVEIHYYNAVPCFYKRGSASVTEAIISGACETIELGDPRRYQKMRPDCEAILAVSCAEFVENYPKFHGFNNYEEMVIKLHGDFVARMSHKESELKILKSFIENDCKASSNSSGKIINQLKNLNNGQEPIITSSNTNSTSTAVCNKFEKLFPVGDKNNSLLYRELIHILEMNIDRPFYGNTIEELIKELNENGPLGGVGYYGQIFYTSNVLLIKHDFAGTTIPVNGWPPNSYKNNKSIDPQNIIIVGAKKDGDKKYVYYISSSTPDKNQCQIYVISHARYIESRKNRSIRENIKESIEISSDKKLPHL